MTQREFQLIPLLARRVLKAHIYAKPTASRETVQLWAVDAKRGMFPERGLTHPSKSMFMGV